MHPCNPRLSAYEFGLELGCERVSPSRLNFGNFGSNGFCAVNSNYEVISTDTAQDRKRSVIAFGNLLDRSGI